MARCHKCKWRRHTYTPEAAGVVAEIWSATRSNHLSQQTFSCLREQSSPARHESSSCVPRKTKSLTRPFLLASPQLSNLNFFRDSPRAEREKKAAKLSCYSFCVLNGHITVICTARSLPASNFLRSPSRPLIIAVHRLLSIDHGRFHGGAVIMLSLDQRHWIISESTSELIIN